MGEGKEDRDRNEGANRVAEVADQVESGLKNDQPEIGERETAMPAENDNHES